MISNEQLTKWERLVQAQSEDEADLLYIFRTYDIIPKLIAEVRTLEASKNRKTEKLNELVAMVDYLIQILASKHICPFNIECPQKTSNYIMQSECTLCWRIEAKKEIKKNDS